MQDPNYLNELFYSTEVWGYLGVFGMIFLAFIIGRKNKFAGVIWYVIMIIMAIDYLGMITASGYYSLHAIFLIFGGLLAIFFPNDD